MGWGLGRQLPDLRIPIGALMIGIAVGVVFLVVGDGDDAALAGSSLVVGCAAAGVGMAPRFLTRDRQLPQR